MGVIRTNKYRVTTFRLHYLHPDLIFSRLQVNSTCEPGRVATEIWIALDWNGTSTGVGLDWIGLIGLDWLIDRIGLERIPLVGFDWIVLYWIGLD